MVAKEKNIPYNESIKEGTHGYFIRNTAMRG